MRAAFQARSDAAARTPRFYSGKDFFTRMDFPLRIYPVGHPASFAAHTHDFVEMVIVNRGHGIHQSRKAASIGPTEFFSRGIMPGDILAIAPGETHAYRHCVNLRLVNVIFSPELVASDLPALRELPGLRGFPLGPLRDDDSGRGWQARLPSGNRAEAEALIAKIREEMALARPGYRLVAKAVFIEFLTLLGRVAPSRNGEKTVPSVTALCHQQSICRAIAFMEENLVMDISLDDLARQARLGRAWFSRRFKDHTGVSPWEYLIRLRIEKAKTMLAATDAPIGDIAFQCGFGDSSYLTRAFRRREGVTPKAFRDMSVQK